MGRAGEDPEVEAWHEAVNASAIFSDGVFRPGVTEGAGATDWRREEARGAPGVSISPGGRMSRSLDGGGGPVLHATAVQSSTLHMLFCAAMALGEPDLGQRFVCEKP